MTDAKTNQQPKAKPPAKPQDEDHRSHLPDDTNGLRSGAAAFDETFPELADK